jgi:hypothetical protein
MTDALTLYVSLEALGDPGNGNVDRIVKGGDAYGIEE